jgi:hypothetical protein
MESEYRSRLTPLRWPALPAANTVFDIFLTRLRISSDFANAKRDIQQDIPQPIGKPADGLKFIMALAS